MNTLSLKFITVILFALCLVFIVWNPRLAFGQQGHTIYHFAQGDWGGIDETNGVTTVLFRVQRSQLFRLRFGALQTICADSSNNSHYPWDITLSYRETVPFLIDGNGRFSGGFEVADFPYKGVVVNFSGHLEGNHGTVYINTEFQEGTITCASPNHVIRVRKLPREIPDNPELPNPQR